MKRVWISLFCIAMVLALAACKKPFGQTPYESVGGEDTSIVTDDDASADESSVDTDTEEPSDNNGGAVENGTTSADAIPTQSAGSENTDGDGTDDSSPSPNGGTVSDDTQTENDNTPVNGTTAKGNRVTNTTHKNAVTTKKAQGTTKKNTAVTTAASSGGNAGSVDNEVELDWGDLMGTTTAKVANGTTAAPTTAKPTTAAPTTQPATTAKPGVRSFPKAGDKVHEKLELGEVKVNGNNGTMIVKNISAGNETEQSSYLLYACYDKNGKSLGKVRINIGRIHAKQQSAPLAFSVPDDTVTMTFKEFVGEFWTDGFH